MKRLYILILIVLIPWGIECNSTKSTPDLGISMDLPDAKDAGIVSDMGKYDLGKRDLESEGVAGTKDIGKSETDITKALDVFEQLGETATDTIQDNGPQDSFIDSGVDEGVNCIPDSCKSLNKECGTWPDGCGGQLDCGQCGLHQVCKKGKCQTQQPYCGDGICQAEEDCASCPEDCGCKNGEVCYQSKCCKPKNCQDLGMECGQASDECGRLLDCGGCDPDESCEQGKCKVVKHITIVLVGDSTVTDKEGWGGAFDEHFISKVTTINKASSGKSSRSYIDRGYWAKAKAVKGDYYLIQFGHNDEHRDYRHTTIEEYKDFLRRYIDETRDIPAKPILVTPTIVTYRKKDGRIYYPQSLTERAEAMAEVAAEKGCELLDLHYRSYKYFDPLTPEETATYQPPGDHVHWNSKGASVLCNLLEDEIIRIDSELKPYLLHSNQE